MDLNKSLRLAIDTGKVSVGANESTKAIASGSAKLVILSSNCPDETVAKAKDGETPVYSFNGNNSVLGAACGKPFPVSIIAILDGGKSDILNLKVN